MGVLHMDKLDISGFIPASSCHMTFGNFCHLAGDMAVNIFYKI